jgi:hypothetical protein
VWQYLEESLGERGWDGARAKRRKGLSKMMGI